MLDLLRAVDNSGSGASEVRRFVDEALRMKEFDHVNVLSLIGVALDFDNLPLVVLPFMRHGDLLSYIRDEANVRCISSDFHLIIFTAVSPLSVLLVHCRMASEYLTL